MMRQFLETRERYGLSPLQMLARRLAELGFIDDDRVLERVEREMNGSVGFVQLKFWEAQFNERN